MKSMFHRLLLGAVVLLAGCAKDNYTAPETTLSGRVTYNGQPVGVRDNAVQLELWEVGWQLKKVIPVFVRNDGTFTATVFDGTYKLVRKRDNGPWVNVADSVDVKLAGNQVLDVPVTPFFNLKASPIARSGSKLTASFTVEQVVPTAKLERVTLYVGTTQFVDANFNAGKTDLTAVPDLTKPVTLEFDLTKAPTVKSTAFVRVGVKTVGVAEMLYTQVEKVTL